METLSYIIAGLLLAFSIYVVNKTTILKDSIILDPSMGNQKSFSFARTQGFWWTTIIAICSILAFGYHGAILINKTCLVLMGIGVGTTAVGKIIDDFDLGAGIPRHQDDPKVDFFMDILSDSTGVSVHRYQLFIFNIIYTVVFLTDFFGDNYSFPEFDNTVLGLLGISSGTYLGMKATENKAVNNG